MKKLLIVASVAMAGGAFVGQGQAAPAPDPMCKMAGQTNNQNWMDHYSCWKGSAAKPVAKPVAAKPSKKDPMCSMGQANNVSWSERYGCWGPAKHW